MPYEMRHEDGKYCIYNSDSGERKACHDSKEDAERQLRLLEAIEHDPEFQPTES